MRDLFSWSESLSVLQEAAAMRLVAPARLSGHSLRRVGEYLGDLPLVEKAVASQLAKITCPTTRFYVQVAKT